MARFSVGRDEDENEERPSDSGPLPKKSRTSSLIYERTRKPDAAAPSTSNASGGATFSTFRKCSAPQSPAMLDFPPEDSDGMEGGSEAGSVDASDRSLYDSPSEEAEEESEEGEEQQQSQRSGDDFQSTEVRVESTPNGNGLCLDSGVLGGPIPLTLTDTDVLDCPICFDPLCSPVYQCENGHIACASCCTRIMNKCASCCLPIGYNRCRAMEKVLESIRTGCRNMPHGCKETFSYSQKLTHEKTCKYAPCSCPHLYCDYVGVSRRLYSHFAVKHSHTSKRFRFNSAISISLDNTQKHVFLQERIRDMLFILSRSIESVGSFIHVVCIAAASAERPFLYDLTATAGESSIRLTTSVECMPKWTAQSPAKTYLVVPKDFISLSGQLKLDLVIRRNPAV